MGGHCRRSSTGEPLELVRGEGPWLFSADGTRYLDAYNNVAVVGHAHPAVTNAVGRQLAVLNTHSRYLHAGVVDLAERVLATMPAELDTCLFTTSGTEAERARLAAGHRVHGRHGGRHRGARLPRIVEVDGRPELERVAARLPAAPRRHVPGAPRSRGRG